MVSNIVKYTKDIKKGPKAQREKLLFGNQRPLTPSSLRGGVSNSRSPPFTQRMPEASDKSSQPYSRAVGTAKWLGLMCWIASVPFGTRYDAERCHILVTIAQNYMKIASKNYQKLRVTRCFAWFLCFSCLIFG